MDMATRAIGQSKVVSAAEWLAARQELLKKEKEFTRLRDELSRQRQELPWEKVEKPYTFDGPQGKETLADLFNGRSQLIVYHFMLGPGWKEGCPSCSFLSDHLDGSVPHLAARDVRLAVVSRAPLAEIEAFKTRMGWRFHWVSSSATDFNYDYHVSRSKEELGNEEVPQRGTARHKRVLQGCRRKHLPHLFKLRPRVGYPGRHLQLAGHRAKRARRTGLGPYHGLGAAPRQI